MFFTNFCYLADIYDRVYPAIERKGLECECVGGGRILHKNDLKELTVYGYSQVCIKCWKNIPFIWIVLRISAF